jgi:hypothetical protein
MPVRSKCQGLLPAVVSGGMRVFVLSALCVLVPTLASAQPPRRTEAAPPPTSPAAEDLEDEDATDSGDASQRDVVEGGRRVRVFRFSGLDIAGRLRSPQLLYFLNRLRAEFDRPRLPHRSFMPELGRSPRSDAF